MTQALSIRNRDPRRLAAVALLALLGGVAAATAQPAVAPPPPDKPADHRHPVAVAAHLLGLSEAQRMQWEEILRQAHEQLQPLQQAVAAKEGELRELLGEEAPAPGLVGGLVLEIRDLRASIGALHDSTGAALLATLDDGQLAVVADVAGAAELAPAVPAFRTLGLI